MSEIQESEHRALLQAESLRNALEEHGLELRVKAAHEAEAACQHRLSVAEAEMAELRTELDTSERFFLFLLMCLFNLNHILLSIFFCINVDTSMKIICHKGTLQVHIG